MAASSSFNLDQSLSRLRSNDSTLTTLDLRKNNIGDFGASALATALQHSSSLTTLNLFLNNIGDSGANALATALQYNSSLTTLDISHNKIGASGASVLATALEHNSSLTTLHLRGISAQSGQALVKQIYDKLELNRGTPKRPVIAPA